MLSYFHRTAHIYFSTSFNVNIDIGFHIGLLDYFFPSPRYTDTSYISDASAVQYFIFICFKILIKLYNYFMDFKTNLSN